MLEHVEPSLPQRIAVRVREQRTARGLSLERLAQHCGISRSMLSLIERGESSPTAVLLEKLARGLGVPLATLFDEPRAAPSPLARAAEQLPWRDPASGYVRRSVSPSSVGSPIRIVDVSFPPKARVAYESGARDPVWHQQVWVLEGTIDVTVGDEQHRLHADDCLAMTLDRPIVFHNPTNATARYAVVIA